MGENGMGWGGLDTAILGVGGEPHAKPHVPSDETPNKKWTAPKHAKPLPFWAIDDFFD